MNKLFVMSLSDKPGEVVYIQQDNLYIFSKADKKFTLHCGTDCSIALLSGYNRDSVHNYPKNMNQPGGYNVERVEVCNTLDDMRNFITQSFT